MKKKKKIYCDHYQDTRLPIDNLIRDPVSTVYIDAILTLCIQFYIMNMDMYENSTSALLGGDDPTLYIDLFKLRCYATASFST